MTVKLLLIWTAVLGLLGSIYLELHQRNQGVLDRVKPEQVQQAPLFKSDTIKHYRQ